MLRSDPIAGPAWAGTLGGPLEPGLFSESQQCQPCLAAHFPQLLAKITPLGRFTPRRGCIIYEAEKENAHLSAPKGGFSAQ